MEISKRDIRVTHSRRDALNGSLCELSQPVSKGAPVYTYVTKLLLQRPPRSLLLL
jgi:hypothetical protein